MSDDLICFSASDTTMGTEVKSVPFVNEQTLVMCEPISISSFHRNSAATFESFLAGTERDVKLEPRENVRCNEGHDGQGN